MNNLYFIKKEIKEIENELKELNNLGSSTMNDMPKGNKVGNPTETLVIRRDSIIKKLNKKIAIYIKEYERTINFINSIDDSEIRLIARLRFLSCKDWQYIAAEISPDDKYIHWTTPRKKLVRYLENKNK